MAIPKPPIARDIIEVTSIQQLGIAIASLAILGYEKEEIIKIVDESYETALDNAAEMLAQDPPLSTEKTT